MDSRHHQEVNKWKVIVTTALFLFVGLLGVLVGFVAGFVWDGAVKSPAPFYVICVPIVAGIVGAVLGIIVGLKGALQHTDE